MALIIKDRVMESSSTTGTGAMTLAGAYTGFRSFSSVCSTNDTCYYIIEAVDSNGVPTGDWETGLGTYSAANTLTRTTVLDSSNSGSAVSFAAGTKRVAISVIASEVAGTVTTTGTPASGELAKFSGAGTITNGDLSGDVTTSGTLATTIAAGAVTYAKLGDIATTAQVQAGTASKIVPADKLVASAAPQTLTDGATISWDMSVGYNAKVTLGGNRTLATPTNPIQGLTYSLNVIQDATGSRTMTWPSAFDWGTTGAPTLTTTASKRDRITLFCTDAATPKFDAFLSGKGFSG